MVSSWDMFGDTCKEKYSNPQRNEEKLNSFPLESGLKLEEMFIKCFRCQKLPTKLQVWGKKHLYNADCILKWWCKKGTQISSKSIWEVLSLSPLQMYPHKGVINTSWTVRRKTEFRRGNYTDRYSLACKNPPKPNTTALPQIGAFELDLTDFMSVKEFAYLLSHLYPGDHVKRTAFFDHKCLI